MSRNSDIPFVKPARVGNFKLWRSKFQVSAYPDLAEDEVKRIVAEKGRVRKEKFDVECINVSNLEGTWKVQVPSTFEMFSVLNALYADLVSGDTKLQSRAYGLFQTILGNMMYASTIGNGFYHRALEMVATCYAYPEMLTKKDGGRKKLKKDVSALIEAFLAWRKLWDKSVEERFDEDKEFRREDVAEQAQEILNKEEDAVEEEDGRGDEEEV